MNDMKKSFFSATWEKISKSKPHEWLLKGVSMTRRKSFADLFMAYLIWNIVFSVTIWFLVSKLFLLTFFIIPFIQAWLFIFGRNFHSDNTFYVETFLEPISERLAALFALGGFHVLIFLCFGFTSFTVRSLPLFIFLVMVTHFSSALIIWRHYSTGEAILASFRMFLRNFYSLAFIYAVGAIYLGTIFYITTFYFKTTIESIFLSILQNSEICTILSIKINGLCSKTYGTVGILQKDLLYVPRLVSILWINIHVFALFIFTHYVSIMNVCGIPEDHARYRNENPE